VKNVKYNKLVRDKIPEYIRAKGGVPVSHVANEAEYWEKLKEKLSEEVKEFQEAESKEEFADLLEVIDAIADHKKFDEREIQIIRESKAAERGRFKDRIILDES
jgi:predicted house-cleaning noncanonical NTP pyrophosphatase (MazG superfamily)